MTAGRKGDLAVRPTDAEAWVRAPENARSRASEALRFTARLTIDVTPEQRGHIKVTAFERGLTMADMLRELLAREFPDNDGDASSPARQPTSAPHGVAGATSLMSNRPGSKSALNTGFVSVGSRKNGFSPAAPVSSALLLETSSRSSVGPRTTSARSSRASTSCARWRPANPIPRSRLSGPAAKSCFALSAGQTSAVS